MRTTIQLKQDLTKEEYQSIEEKARRAMLFALLAEAGYEIAKMQKLCYTSWELRERLIAAIRTDKLTIKELRKKIEEIRKENESRAQILFDFCKSELERETV
jgi:hypothetical protein